VQVGYELLKEQLFFRKELVERLPWLIRLRWIVACAGLTGYSAVSFFRETLLPFPLLLILICVLLYNLIFKIIWQNTAQFKHQNGPSSEGTRVISDGEIRSFTVFAHFQISADLLLLFPAVYYSGGIYSPVVYFFIFHIIITGILLPPAGCYLYAVVVSAATGIMIMLQRLSLIPESPLLFHGFFLSNRSGDDGHIIRYLALITVLVFTAFLVTTIKLGLRGKGRELLKLSKELDESNSKLKALYEMVREMGICSEQKALMDSATRQAAGIMGVKACSIKLIDEAKGTLRFASAYGLSEDYTKTKKTIDIEKSPINRKILEGSVSAIGNIEESDYFQYPEDIRKEGIASMLCLPLRVDRLILGVFCVYSETEHYFSGSDVEFFALVADLTALEIDRLNTQINRTWFMQKAAHQIRSPQHTVAGLLKIMREGYLGPVNARQEEALTRCEKRLEMSDRLVSDLLRLGMGRETFSRDEYHPVFAQKVLMSIAGLFETQAGNKSVKIGFSVDESLPAVSATERLLDDLFSNLISNAIKYTPAGGCITVGLTIGEGGEIRFEVTDTGIGIPEEAFPRLFNEFFRAENAKEYAEEGTGLGLVIVKEILDRLKGTVSVKSKAGEGSTFTCHIPIIGI
jgi:K+-sensing histidine kinase KdpD